MSDAIEYTQLDSLYSNHHGWLLGWLRGRLGNVMDAEHLVQDTFVRVIRAPRKTNDIREPGTFCSPLPGG